MSNNRITYATAQLAIKDNRIDRSTTHVMNDTLYPPTRTLASGISAAQKEIAFNAAASGTWGETGVFRVKSAAGYVEYIYWSGWLSEVLCHNCQRGVGGSTAAVHSASDFCQKAGWEIPLGIQSVSIGTTFNTEDVFTLGELDAYENVEGIPDVEVTIERVLDGTKPLFLMCTDGDYTTLKGRTANYKADLAVSIYPDSQDSAYGTADSTCTVSGCYLSSWTLSMPSEGNFTESVSLVGNDKQWGTASPAVAAAVGVPSGFFISSSQVDAAVIGSGVQRTENFDATNSTLPSDYPLTDHIQSIEVSVDLTREEIRQLGSKTPYYRAIDWPVSVTTTIETITDKGDLIDAIGHNGQANLTNQTIILRTTGGLIVNLGTKNKIANLTFEGFDAGGGNGSVTYEYTNSNGLNVSHLGFIDWNDTNF